MTQAGQISERLAIPASSTLEIHASRNREWLLGVQTKEAPIASVDITTIEGSD